MLRASSEAHEESVDLHAIRGEGHDSGIEHGDRLVAFAEAIVAADREAIARTRDALVAAMGEPAMIDAAGVASNFERMVRIADATRIPLNAEIEEATADVRGELGLGALPSAPP